LRLRHADVCLLVVIAFACHLRMIPNIAASGLWRGLGPGARLA